MIKTLALSLTAAAALAGPAMAQTYNVGISAEPYPPFYAPDASGAWSGWEIDFMNAVCDRIGAECVVTPVAWEGIIPALNTGKIDMIIGSMGITPERAEQIAFSDKYYDTPTGVVALASTDVQPTPEGVTGAYLGAQSGSIQENYVAQYFAETAADVRIYQTLDEELQDLAAGRIDAVVGDTLAMQPFIDSEAGQACCEYRGAVENDPDVLGRGVGIGLRKDDTELLETVNAAIAEIRSDGTYEEISAPYFGDLDIYGE
ncbi:transporter substrate-binding domain-containing protein [Pseudoroseicyclus aestuarii]|uniref:Amino acid ABC transporter substrate-binding protein (PAAT family) n=1 Tax=Pseudoroseicyclus aestuarii TaxID=1795041 RepID=A0A318SYE4_9RHOB|nr:transporter substrate-binding domain-containing protein [Pseudoroseicyclus aestuarii]PYE84857.1 amino acid ABC transporter substrate-binding protein (PAAT family) [Pseudoroseicyclus aestuarii]